MAPLLALVLGCGGSGTSEHGGSGAAPTNGGSAGAGGGGSGGTSSSSGGTTTGSGGTSSGGGGTSSGTGGTTAGNGGSGGSQGAAGGAGGSGGSGGSTSGASGSGGGTSAFTLKVELSSAIPTVGIATWSLASAVDSAVIDFGRDQAAFEFQAPVDLAADMHRTLLLGMKSDTTYYARVTAKGGSQTYVSDVASFKTGYLPNGLPVQTITDHDAASLYAGGGFTVACTGYDTFGGGFGGGGTSTGSWAWIFDRDGDPVWALDLATTPVSACTRARMSYDGKYLWAGNFGNTTTDGALTRLSMDGLGTPDSYSLPGRSHDFAILPNEHVVYFARNNMSADQSPESIRELDPTTSMNTLIYDELTDFSALISDRGGHTNQVNYVPELEAISFSMYFADTVALVSYPEGKLLAAFGGDNSTFSGMTWSGQHGHDVRADHVDIFNNNGTNGGASVLRFQYDLGAKTATAQTDYSSGLDSPAFGDVKEQPNGNFFVTYSIASVMHELDPSLKLLREIQTSVAIAYVEHRATLYGKPPPYDR